MLCALLGAELPVIFFTHTQPNLLAVLCVCVCVCAGQAFWSVCVFFFVLKIRKNTITKIPIKFPKYRTNTKNIIKAPIMLNNNRGKGHVSRGREQAASASTGQMRGRGRGRGRGACVAGMPNITTDELVDWMTRPSSSSSSSVTQGQSNSSTAAVQAATLASASSATPAIAPPTCMEESAELFEHSVGQLLLENPQSEVEAIGSHVPAAAAYCQVGSGDEEDDDDDVSDRTWVPGRNEESEEESERRPRAARGGSQRRGGSKCTISPSVQAGAAQVTPSRPVTYGSASWAFFNRCTADPTIVVCSLCLQRVKRGSNVAHLGTTCMKRHLAKHHTARWNEYLTNVQLQKGSSPSPPPHLPHAAPTSSHSRVTPSTRHAVSAASTETDDGVEVCVPGPSCSAASTTPPVVQSSHHSQVTVPQLFKRKRKYTPSHPHAQRLNASLAKLLALQLLPFQLVESAAFREFAQCAVPQWQVPSRHFFSRKALPALHRHLEGNVLTSLDHAVCSKVHLTTDSWSSKFGQGRYLSFTAHWVTLLTAAKGAGHGSPLELVLPPRVGTAGGHGAAAASSSTLSSSYTSSSSSSLPSSPESLSETPVLSKKSRGYAGAQAKRCHAVLELVCIGERSHTGAEILAALHGQAQKWFSPRQLEPGMVVCDNGSNLLAALRQGKLVHVPCLAHVLNLVVQRFLDNYPGLSDLLRQVRRVCSHFRRSYGASVRLSELQREFHLPNNRLICDLPTRWNSTLAMLKRLHTHQRAINEYLCDYGTRTGSAEIGFFSPRQWLMVQDACTVLSPFEDATKMVSRDSACISDTIPLIIMLEHTLHGIMERALESEQRQQEEDFLSSQGPLYPDHVPIRLESQEEEEEEDNVFPGSTDCPEMRASGGVPVNPSLVRGWGESLPDPVQLSDPEDLGSSSSTNLRLMGSLILKSLRKDPRIRAIKERDNYWLATLLDPRYKGKFSELILPFERDSRTKHLQESLVTALVTAFPDTHRSARQVGAQAPMGASRSGGQGGRLSDAFTNFFSYQRPSLSSANTHRQRLRHMVQDYMGSRADLETFTSGDPLSYWVMRIDHWPQLSQYALELLACPAASVLSERAFSAAGGFVTDSRVRLSTDSVDRLTFIKMNQSWIGSNYIGPDADAAD